MKDTIIIHQPSPPEVDDDFVEKPHDCDYCHGMATRFVTYDRIVDSGLRRCYDFICNDCYGIEFQESDNIIIREELI